MTKINTKQQLVSFKGEPILEAESKKVITVGEVLANIMAGSVSNPALGWSLGKKFATQDSVDLKAEEVVFLKKAIEENKILTALVSGQLLEIIEN